MEYIATTKEYYAEYTTATKVLHLGVLETGQHLYKGQETFVHNPEPSVVIAAVNAANLNRTITIEDFNPTEENI